MWEGGETSSVLLLWEDKFCALLPSLPEEEEEGGGGAFLRRGETEGREGGRLFIKAVKLMQM